MTNRSLRTRALIAFMTVVLLCVGGLAGALIGVSSVSAAPPVAPIRACVNDQSGAIRIVDDPSGLLSENTTSCNSTGEHEIDWGLQGAPGPAGAAGAAGPVGSTGATGATGATGHLDPATATSATRSFHQVGSQAAALARQWASDQKELKAVAGHELQLMATLPNSSRFSAQLRKLVGAKAAGDLLAAGGLAAPGKTLTKADIDTAKADVQNQLDSLSELSETESLRLQMAMDRVSKFMQALSNLEKKSSDTDSELVQNFK